MSTIDMSFRQIIHETRFRFLRFSKNYENNLCWHSM